MTLGLNKMGYAEHVHDLADVKTEWNGLRSG